MNYLLPHFRTVPTAHTCGQAVIQPHARRMSCHSSFNLTSTGKVRLVANQNPSKWAQSPKNSKGMLQKVSLIEFRSLVLLWSHLLHRFQSLRFNFVKTSLRFGSGIQVPSCPICIQIDGSLHLYHLALKHCERLEKPDQRVANCRQSPPSAASLGTRPTKKHKCSNPRRDASWCHNAPCLVLSSGRQLALPIAGDHLGRRSR